MLKIKNIKRRIALGAVLTVALMSGLFAIYQNKNTDAADLSNFNPGNIISDAIFTNSDSMSVQQIQNFLDSKVKCDNYGVKRSELGGGTRAQWLAARGYNTPIRCINDYRENPNNGQNNYGKNESPEGSLSAAQLIYNYSRQFGINPQVLLVTLQKENGLITDEWPTHKQFREAMGFGCPDNVAPGAPACDPNYGTFSAQLYQAARHFKGYMERRTGWYVPYKIGMNKIMWHPNSGCGVSDVYIENNATVALYSYTPYRPNQAALNAGYGTGDGCSSYGNRNFYNYFNDWFGSTNINSSLLRTASDATVYLVGDNVKYPISSMGIASSLSSVLGGISFVSDSYLSKIPTGQLANKLIRDSNGTIYFYASGIKLPFTSCGLVADYGYSCGEFMQLTDAQIAKFANGPLMLKGLKTTTGKSFYIQSGQKHEIFDDESMKLVNGSVGYNVLGEDSVDHLSLGSPIIKDNAVIVSSNNKYLKIGDRVLQLKDSQIVKDAFSNFDSKGIMPESLAKLKVTGEISNVISSESGHNYIIATDGKKILNNYEYNNSQSVVLPDSTVNKIKGSGSLTAPALIKSLDNGTVYAVINNQKRPLVSMGDLESITGEKNPYIAWLDNSYVNSIPDGNIIIGAGRLVKTPTDATVYMSDGTDGLLPMTSFTPASDLGINMDIRTISDAILSKYNVKHNSLLSQYVTCNGHNYLGMSGNAYRINITGAHPLVLDQKTCNVITKKENTPNFLRRSDGTIFYRQGDTLKPIASFQKFIELSATFGSEVVNASNQAINMFKVGEVL